MTVARDDLPSGTVTFLFTDVEGSTKLLAELGDGYADALAHHRLVLQSTCSGRGGVLVDTQGDATFYAFASPSAAVEAAEEAQRELELPVRMGIHTGEATLAGGGYVGIEVHRAARISAAGHGRQVLLSESVREACPLQHKLTELGEHRLKDFAEPVSLYQLGEASFPPLKTISNTNLPRPAGSFVGREQEVLEVAALLHDGARLLTLTGPGGTGKTRLAVEAAAELVPEFKAGVFWVGLAPLRDPALVGDTIAQTLGAKDGLAEHIGERELLLLLDNLEQVVEAAPELAALAESCPNLKLLVTSRELLRVRGELEYPVLPLAEPDAVALFCERARLEPDETVTALCRRLDSLPLAVELAAARTSVLSPAQILERLSGRLDLLKGGRDADPRQQTLRTTIAWSHDLLSPEELELFRRLSVFAGGCTLEAAEQVCGAELDTLQSLVEKSLLRHSEERFWMLETIREYALERLEDSGEADELRRHHAEHVLALAEEARPHLTAGGQEEWLQRIETERDNVRAALAWCFGGGQAELGLRIAATLGRFWWVRGPAEGLAWLDRGLAEARSAPAVRADALDAAGSTAWFLGDHERALRLFEEGLALYRELDDRQGIGTMLNRLGPPLVEAGRPDEAEALVEEAATIHRELANRGELALSLHILGVGASERRDFARARDLLEESAGLAREIGDSVQLAYDLLNLAELALEDENDAGRGLRIGRETLALARELGDDLLTLGCLGMLSVAALRGGDPGRAGALWGAADRFDEELGETMWRRERHRLEAMLGEREPEFEQSVEDGRRLSLEQAVDLAFEA